jgi:hypothetical protein
MVGVSVSHRGERGGRMVWWERAGQIGGTLLVKMTPHQPARGEWSKRRVIVLSG